MTAALPFLTLPDPLVTGEGALDPLGLAMIGDHLANHILPGLRARMSRPRFITAIAVSAAVCEGLEDRFAADGVTPAYLVFEWLVVEAFVRAGQSEATLRTPGTMKAQDARASDDAMCARNYLKTPTVFGFHGVYKPIARHLGVVDDDLRLSDHGYELLKVWQSEQQLEGFLDNTSSGGTGRSARYALRAAVDEGLAAGHTARRGGWQGWSIIAEHLAPGNMGPNEAAFIRRLVADPDAAPRGEIFKLLREGDGIEASSEDAITRSLLLPNAGAELAGRLKAIMAYETVCGVLEETFDWICFLSTHSQARPITAQTFAGESRTRQLSKDLPAAIRHAESAMSASPLNVQQLFAQLAKSFDAIRDADTLFEAVLAHHERVQNGKPPEGKRSWFERSPNGETFVRPPYRAVERPVSDRGWNRPYRIGTVLSFIDDLKVEACEPA